MSTARVPTRPATEPLQAGEDLQGAYARLLRKAYAFDFFQATYLAERLFGDVAPPRAAGQPAPRSPVAFRPSARRAFPGADVERVERTPNGARVVATFMGLYGPNAVLPAALHRRIDDGDERTHPLRDFLDLFNHRFLAYAYRAWKKVRPELHQGASAEAPFERFAAAAGLALPLLAARRGALPDLPPALVGFAGRLSSPARNPDGLRALVEHQLGVPARIEEHVPRWIRVENRPQLGSGAPFRLGSGATLGARVLDHAGQFRIVLGPLGLDAYEALLPEGALARRLAALVRLYVPDTLTYDVELRLDPRAAEPVRLGNTRSRMGATVFLGTPRARSLARIVRYEPPPS